MSTSSSFVPKLIANKQNVADKLVVPSSKIPKPHKKENVQPEPIFLKEFSMKIEELERKLEEERFNHEKKDKTIEQLTKMVPIDLNTSAAAKNNFFDSNGFERPSIICRRVRFSDSPHQLIKLTATGFDMVRKEYVFRSVPDERVAFPIHDGLKKKLGSEKRKKFIVFCPSVHGKGGVEQYREWISRDYPGTKVVCFHRQTYASQKNIAAASSISDESIVVLTTNIPDVGIYWQFDENKRKIWFRKQVGPATRAQIIQREGRVGRGKQGIYVYDPYVEDGDFVYHSNSISLFEALLIWKSIGPLGDWVAN
uniref:Uncharacterized protein n=1 Tax=Panagrolaimus sp. JU765 TaxID=591449 RepID=A0AC34RNE8_9BILA